jgi:peptide deformylase
MGAALTFARGAARYRGTAANLQFFPALQIVVAAQANRSGMLQHRDARRPLTTSCIMTTVCCRDLELASLNVINSRSQIRPLLATRWAFNIMAVMEILEFPDTRLRIEAKPVAQVTDATRTLIDNMLETMYAAPGIGLAATQVNVHQRLLVMDISEDKSQPQVFINPQLTVLDPDLGEYDEGCLSVPGFYETVRRPLRVSVSALGRDGKPFTCELEGLGAICLQHEIDHLDGKLFVDYLTPLKRQRIRKKLEKDQRERA